MADLSVTPASVGPVSGTPNDTQFGEGTAGATILAGQTIYIDTANSNVIKLADANAASPAYVVAGVAMHGASAGQPIKYAKAGKYTAGGTIVVGTVYVQSATAGGICPAADLASGHFTTVIGIGETAAYLRLVLATAGVAVP